MSISPSRRPRKRNNNFTAITIIEFVLSILVVIVFWQDIVAVFTAIIDFLFPRQNLTMPKDTIQSLISLITAGAITAINLVLFLFVFTRKAGLPIFGFDDIVRGVPLESDEPDPKHLANPLEPPPASDARNYFSGRISQLLAGTFLQVLWFFGLRGMNVFVQRGSPKSQELGTAHTLIPGSIASDYDSGYVLDSPQNEGDRTNILPITGWYGLRFPFRRSLRGSARLDRLNRQERDVSAFTRDGIEVVADVSATFLLGQTPECVEIAYHRPYRIENQHIVQSREVSEPYPGVTISTRYKDSLDPQDQYYVHQQLRSLIHSNEPQAFVRAPDTRGFEFNRDRVFRAITAQSLVHHGDFQEWEQIPLHYTKEVFENILLNYTFDELFGERNEITGDTYPILEINEEIRRRVRNNSLLSFRLLWHKQSFGLADTEEGVSPYPRDQILCAPQRQGETNEPRLSINLPIEPLQADVESDGKLLRACGIRLLMAEF